MADERKGQKLRTAERKVEEILKGAKVDQDVMRLASNPPKNRDGEQSQQQSTG